MTSFLSAVSLFSDNTVCIIWELPENRLSLLYNKIYYNYNNNSLDSETQIRGEKSLPKIPLNILLQ
jgi:hypothetical protein